MRFRAKIAEKLNALTEEILGHPAENPINITRARKEVDYNQCYDLHKLVAGAPGAYLSRFCIFEVDTTKRLGPFTNPKNEEGYPNYSFFIPGNTWLKDAYAKVRAWIKFQLSLPEYEKYQVLFHPNTGCEIRDHVDLASIEWFGHGKSLPLKPSVFSCNALGCNQACGSERQHTPPSNC
eukprot:g3548.t1